MTQVGYFGSKPSPCRCPLHSVGFTTEGIPPGCPTGAIPGGPDLSQRDRQDGPCVPCDDTRDRGCGAPGRAARAPDGPRGDPPGVAQPPGRLCDPAVLFYTTFVLAGVWTAILVALCWSYGAITWRAVTGPAYLGAAHHHRDPDHASGGRLAGRRQHVPVLLAADHQRRGRRDDVPAVAGDRATDLLYRLAGDFYPMTDELRLRHASGGCPATSRYLWAVLCIGKASFTLWLLQVSVAGEPQSSSRRDGAGRQHVRRSRHDRHRRPGRAPRRPASGRAPSTVAAIA